MSPCRCSASTAHWTQWPATARSLPTAHDLTRARRWWYRTIVSGCCTHTSGVRRVTHFTIGWWFLIRKLSAIKLLPVSLWNSACAIRSALFRDLVLSRGLHANLRSFTKEVCVALEQKMVCSLMLVSRTKFPQFLCHPITPSPHHCARYQASVARTASPKRRSPAAAQPRPATKKGCSASRTARWPAPAVAPGLRVG